MRFAAVCLSLGLWLLGSDALALPASLYRIGAPRAVRAAAHSPVREAAKLDRFRKTALLKRKFLVSTFDGRVFLAVRDRSSARAATRNIGSGTARVRTYAGKLYQFVDSRRGSPAGEFTVSTVNGEGERFAAVFGQFQLSSDPTSYRLKTSKNHRTFMLEEIDELQQPGCPGHLEHEHAAALVTDDAMIRTSSTVEIDVLVLYSPEALAAAGGTSNIVGEIEGAVTSANLGYTNSGISQTVRLVYAGPTTTTENADMAVDLTRLATSSDGFYSEADTLADAYGADIVVLLSEHASSGFCGIGYLGYGASVVRRDCISNLTFQHEMGHNMGADHDQANASGGAYSYSYGHRFIGNSSNQYRTVMAYSPGTRINYFSNPSVTYDGVATGTGSADNAQTLNNTAASVANFRPTPSASPTPGATPTATATPEGGAPPEATATATPVAAGGAAAKIVLSKVRSGSGYRITGELQDIVGSAAVDEGVVIGFKATGKKTFKVIKRATTSGAAFTFRATKSGKYRAVLDRSAAIGKTISVTVRR